MNPSGRFTLPDTSLKGLNASLFDDGTEEGINVPLTSLRAFKGHPFEVREDAALEALTASIRENGVLVPLLVRPAADRAGVYEIISGHRRHTAAAGAGLTEVPVIIRELSDDDAVLAMVDSNLQRETLLPSERIRSVRMKYDILVRKRADSCPGQSGAAGTRTRDLLAPEFGVGGRQLSRYLELSELPGKALVLLDERKLAASAALVLARFSPLLQGYGIRAVTEGRKLTPGQLQPLLEKNGTELSYSEFLELLEPKVEDTGTDTERITVSRDKAGLRICIPQEIAGTCFDGMTDEAITKRILGMFPARS